jgi:hypothetical protein
MLRLLRRHPAGVVLIVLLVSGLGYRLERRVADRCERETITDKVVALLRSKNNGHEGVYIRNIQLAPGELLTWPYRCEAEVAPIVNDADLADEPWKSITYAVSSSAGAVHVALVDKK